MAINIDNDNLSVDEGYTGKTRLKAWWPIVKSNFSGIRDYINAFVSAFRTHKNTKATETVLGHITLSDATDSQSAASGSVGATPKAVKTVNDALTTHKTKEILDHPDSSVITRKLADSAVTTAKLNNGAVTEDKIIGFAVTNGKLANNAVTREKIKDGEVTTAKLASYAVTADKLGVGAVSTLKLAQKAVTEEKIDDGAVTTAKLDNGAVTEDKINEGAVTNEKLDSAVQAKVNGDIYRCEPPTPTTSSLNNSMIMFLTETGDFTVTRNDKKLAGDTSVPLGKVWSDEWQTLAVAIDVIHSPTSYELLGLAGRQDLNYIDSGKWIWTLCYVEKNSSGVWQISDIRTAPVINTSLEGIKNWRMCLDRFYDIPEEEIDTELSSQSTNPVQNKVIKAALDSKSNASHTHNNATASAAGLMSAADKKKLDAVISETPGVSGAYDVHVSGELFAGDIYDVNVINFLDGSNNSGSLTLADVNKLNAIEAGAQKHKAPTKAEITAAVGTAAWNKDGLMSAADKKRLDDLVLASEDMSVFEYFLNKSYDITDLQQLRDFDTDGWDVYVNTNSVPSGTRWLRFKAVEASNKYWCIGGDIVEFVSFKTGNNAVFAKNDDVVIFSDSSNRYFVLDDSVGWDDLFRNIVDIIPNRAITTDKLAFGIDTYMSGTSTNPVQNKVVKAALDGKENAFIHPTWTYDADNFEYIARDDIVMDYLRTNDITLKRDMFLEEDEQNGYVALSEVTADVNRVRKLYYHETTPQMIGTWIDNTPLWRVAFKRDLTATEIADKSISVSSLIEATDFDNVFVINYKIYVHPFEGDPCIRDDFELTGINFDWLDLPGDPVDGAFIYGYIEFVTPKSNLKEG